MLYYNSSSEFVTSYIDKNQQKYLRNFFICNKNKLSVTKKPRLKVNNFFSFINFKEICSLEL